MVRRIPTPYAGASRIRFEGLRRSALSAPGGAPLSADQATPATVGPHHPAARAEGSPARRADEG